MNWTVTYVFGTAQDLLLDDCKLSMVMHPFLAFPSQVFHFSCFVLLILCYVVWMQHRWAANEMWSKRAGSVVAARISIRGWHWFRRRVRACSTVATLSHSVTQEGCLKTKAPRTFVSSTVASTILLACHAKNPDSQHGSETIPNYSCKTPWL